MKISPTGKRPPQTLFIAAAAANIVGQLNIILTSFLLPFSMQQLHISNLAASKLITAELFVYLVTALVASTVRRFSPKPIAVAGCVLYAMGSFGAAFSNEPLTFIICRLFCGVGGALALISANRSMASHHEYAKLLSAAIIASVAFAVVALVAIPALFEWIGSVAAYVALGSVASIASLASLGLSKGSREIPVGIGLNFGAAAWLLVIAFFLSRLSDGVILPHVESFGVRVGLGPTTVGIVLAAVTFPSVIAVVLAARIVTAKGLLMLILAALLVKLSGAILMQLSPNLVGFSIAQLATSVGYVLAAQLFLTRFSEIDANGRLSGFANTAGLAADTSGLAFGSQVFATASFAGVTWLTAAIAVSAILLCSYSFPRARAASASSGNFQC
jgi:predicted MFS family arabinose efflux permease